MSYYNVQGQVAETVSASGFATGAVYNPDGSVLYSGRVTVLPDGQTPAGRYVAFADAVNVPAGSAAYLTDYTTNLANQVDAQGNLFSRTIDQLGYITDTYQDASGRTIETVYDDGSFTQTVYSVGDQPVTALPAPMGWMVATGGAAAITLSPPAGLMIPAGGSETVTVAQRKLGDTPVVTYDVYDKAGNLVDVYEPAVLDGDPASATYGQMVSPHTHYAYDASGNEILQVSATEESAYATWLAGSRATPFTGGTTWTYDENGNELSRRLPDGEQETYTYDQYGNQITHVDFDGNTATSTYYTTGTQAGLLHQVVYTPGAGAAAGTTPQTVTYTYDDLGRQQSVAIATGPAGSQTTATTTDSYDAQGNLEEEQTPEGTIWYVFDPKTGLQTETYTDYTQTFYGYDDQGRLTSVSVQTRGTPTGTWSAPMVTTYTYDADGNKHTELLPNGILTTYGYRHLPGGRFIAALARSPGQRREAQ